MLAVVVVLVLECLDFLSSKKPKAILLPRDLARAGLALGDVFQPDQLELEEVWSKSDLSEVNGSAAGAGYHGSNLLAFVDEKNRLSYFALFADTGVFKLTPGLPFIDPEVSSLRGSLLKLDRTEIEQAYGPPSWIDGSAYLYDYDLGVGAGIVEVVFFFIAEREIKPNDPLMGMNAMLYEGDKATVQYEFITEQKSRIYQWPL